jgi:hypothetical protein
MIRAGSHFINQSLPFIPSNSSLNDVGSRHGFSKARDQQNLHLAV